MDLNSDLWNKVSMCFVTSTYLDHPDEWRLPWAELLRDIGNLGSVSKAARDGCILTTTVVAGYLRKNISPQAAHFYDTVRPVIAGSPFSMTVRKLLPFTAASHKDFAAKTCDYYLLKKPTHMPVEMLEMRRIEGCQKVRATNIIRHLHKFGDRTAQELLFDVKYSQYLEGTAYSVIPTLCRCYGTPEHARQTVRRLREQKQKFYQW